MEKLEVFITLNTFKPNQFFDLVNAVKVNASENFILEFNIIFDKNNEILNDKLNKIANFNFRNILIQDINQEFKFKIFQNAILQIKSIIREDFKCLLIDTIDKPNKILNKSIYILDPSLSNSYIYLVYHKNVDKFDYLNWIFCYSKVLDCTFNFTNLSRGSKISGSKIFLIIRLKYFVHNNLEFIKYINNIFLQKIFSLVTKFEMPKEKIVLKKIKLRMLLILRRLKKDRYVLSFENSSSKSDLDNIGLINIQNELKYFLKNNDIKKLVRYIAPNDFEND